MRIPRPRFTVRRLMVAVAVAAVALAGLIQAGKVVRLRQTLIRHDRLLAYFDEGRVTVDRCVDSSRRVMEAESDLALTRGGRVAALSAHVRRSARLIEFERKQLDGQLNCRGGLYADLAEAEMMLDEGRAALARLIPEGK